VRVIITLVCVIFTRISVKPSLAWVWNHALRVEITLMRVGINLVRFEITVVSVVSTFVRVKITMRVEITLCVYKSQSRVSLSHSRVSNSRVYVSKLLCVDRIGDHSDWIGDANQRLARAWRILLFIETLLPEDIGNWQVLGAAIRHSRILYIFACVILIFFFMLWMFLCQ
jgi:hypothetical protein